jgi:hypothetical protein
MKLSTVLAQACAVFGLTACCNSGGDAAETRRENACGNCINPSAVLMDERYRRGYGVLVYEFTPKSDPTKICIVSSSTEGIAQSCFPRPENQQKAATPR